MSLVGNLSWTLNVLGIPGLSGGYSKLRCISCASELALPRVATNEFVLSASDGAGCEGEGELKSERRRRQFRHIHKSSLRKHIDMKCIYCFSLLYIQHKLDTVSIAF